ncbi:Helicase conserved C-terminal domain [Rhizoctonia solani]|uniref:ATP-dependent RNA helicase n=1 Tax=Rhizoctonia solani TaxID=456999 RepID=A0A8H8NZB0_9AGAM|nr:Helicase conserved C-terminal domain [Rhizoctonia solani]QRW20822.1 Helicase conserved C-terminal domain [Rhizoctonia solani]
MGPSFDVLSSIKSVFPHVEKPTQVQGRLIPAIMQGHDVILMDETGKTFGSVLALLPEIARPNTGITTLHCSHRDLAYQIESWCQKLVTSQPSTSIDPSTVVRVIARPNTTLKYLRRSETTLLASWCQPRVDEVENPLAISQSAAPELSHPEAAQPSITTSSPHVGGTTTQAADGHDERDANPPCAVMVIQANGWMSERVVRILEFKKRSSRASLSLANTKKLIQVPKKESEEFCPGILRGILSGDPEAILGLLDREGDGATLGSRPGPTYQLPTRLAKGITLPPSILEAVATSVALDVSHRALLVIPNGVSIGPVVEALRELGVEARTLNLKDEIEHVSNRLENEQEVHSKPSSATTSSDRSLAEDEGEDFVSNPTLLIATTTAVRGIDIPTLSHVYIVGGLESEEIYRHVAGRAGRFGMPGTVISL